MKCPKCGSTKIMKWGTVGTLQGEKQRYHCHKGHTFYAKGKKKTRKGKRKKRG